METEKEPRNCPLRDLWYDKRWIDRRRISLLRNLSLELSLLPGKVRGRGFTLIELIVNIFIIGLLVAIAIPAYISYSRRAVDEHMIRDLKNATIAMESYYVDKKIYTSSVSDLAGMGFRQTPGVTLAITVTSVDSYSMTASKPNGTKPSFSFDSNIGLIQ